MLDRPEPYEAHMHRATRTVHESNWWVMRLKAIANPGNRRGGSRWRSGHLAKRRRPPRPRRGSVLGAVRLLRGSWCGAGRRLSLWKTGRQPGLSHVPGLGRAAAACRDRRGVAAAAQPTALTTTWSRLYATLAEQASAAVHVPARAPRMKRSSSIRSHGQPWHWPQNSKSVARSTGIPR